MSILNAFFAATITTVDIILGFYVYVLIIGAVLSWLVAFNVVNTHNRFVQVLGDITFRLTEPLLHPIRRRIPSMGGIDLSPLILIFAILFLQSFLRHLGGSL